MDWVLLAMLVAIFIYLRIAVTNLAEHQQKMSEQITWAEKNIRTEIANLQRSMHKLKR